MIVTKVKIVIMLLYIPIKCQQDNKEIQIWEKFYLNLNQNQNIRLQHMHKINKKNDKINYKIILLQ